MFPKWKIKDQGHPFPVLEGYGNTGAVHHPHSPVLGQVFGCSLKLCATAGIHGTSKTGPGPEKMPWVHQCWGVSAVSIPFNKICFSMDCAWGKNSASEVQLPGTSRKGKTRVGEKLIVMMLF